MYKIYSESQDVPPDDSSDVESTSSDQMYVPNVPLSNYIRLFSMGLVPVSSTSAKLSTVELDLIVHIVKAVDTNNIPEMLMEPPMRLWHLIFEDLYLWYVRNDYGYMFCLKNDLGFFVIGTSKRRVFVAINEYKYVSRFTEFTSIDIIVNNSVNATSELLRFVSNVKGQLKQRCHKTCTFPKISTRLCDERRTKFARLFTEPNDDFFKLIAGIYRFDDDVDAGRVIWTIICSRCDVE